jgi:predicted dehydrogenase
MLGELGSGKHKRKIVYEQPEVREVNALRCEFESFVQCISTGKQPLVSGEDGLRALETASLIMEKIGKQRFVM